MDMGEPGGAEGTHKIKDSKNQEDAQASLQGMLELGQQTATLVGLINDQRQQINDLLSMNKRLVSESQRDRDRDRDCFTSTPYRDPESERENMMASYEDSSPFREDRRRQDFSRQARTLQNNRHTFDRSMGNSHGNNSSFFQDTQRPKMACFDGTDDWEGFILPFERMSRRNGWSDIERLDRLHSCLRKSAAKFAYTLPEEVLEDYHKLKEQLKGRFGRDEPPSTLRKKLSELRQKNETIDEFAESVRRLAAKAFPSVPLAMQEELAAEAFLKGISNTRIAFEVMNKEPKSVSEALELVTTLEHNYKATVGRDSEGKQSRRVSWDTASTGEKAVTTLTENKFEEVMKRMEKSISDLTLAIKGKIHDEQIEREKSKDLRCYKCNQSGHFQRDCHLSRSPSPSPARRRWSPSPNYRRSRSNSPVESPSKIKRLSGNGSTMLVDVTVNGKICSAVVDTGADCTVLSQSFAKKLGLQPGSEEVQLLNAQTGRSMTAIGGMTTLIKLGSEEVEWQVCIAPISDTMLIGMDLLRHLNAIVLTRDGDLVINGSRVEGKSRGEGTEFRAARVKLVANEIIPPRCEKVVLGRITDPSPSTLGVLDPSDLQDDVHAGSSLVYMDNVIPVRVLNVAEKDVKLSKGTLLGKITEAEQISSSSKLSGTVRRVETSAPKQKLPQHLDDLFQKASADLTTVEAKQFRSLLLKHHEVFAKDDMDLGTFSEVKHTIETGSATPIRQPVRRTPIGFQEEERAHLQLLLDSGVVEPSRSEWASPVVLVRKKDGGVRWCIDYRKLNDRTVKDAYPLPKIEECLDTLGQATLFSTLDLQSGYHQIELASEDKNKTAFITKFGLYQYTRMPFGLCSAPSTFQRAMELVFQGIQWEYVLIYLDDIIVISGSVLEHIQRLDEVLTRLNRVGLKLKPRKCHLMQTRVLFLGHVISSSGVETNPELTKTIRSWPEPTREKELSAFLGLTNYYRKFIKGYANIAQPLYNLLKKGTKFIWNSTAQAAFEELREKLTNPPVLAFPKSEGTFILDTDASNDAIGAVLSQVQENECKVIAYASRTLGTTQRRYCVTRRELLAVVAFIHYFRHYLLGREFLLRTDHASLAWLFRFKSPEGQLARWLEELSQYQFIIEHRKGTNHSNADALSRQKTSVGSCNCYDIGTKLVDLPCGGCNHCQKRHTEWEKFQEDVDDIVPLAIRHVELRESKDTEEKTDGFNSLTVEEIKKEQKKDPDLQEVYHWLTTGTVVPQEMMFSESPALRRYWLFRNQLKLRDDIIYYQWEGSSAHDWSLRLIVPETLKKRVLSVNHDALYAGHPGSSRMLERLKLRYYWHNMADDVEQYVLKCATCCAQKKSCKAARAPLKSYQAGTPMDRIHIDILGPFPKSESGNKYILVLTDQFSKWAEAYAISDQEAKTTAQKVVEEFICRFGTPGEIHTDQGKNFDSKLFRETCTLLQVSKTRTTPYYPASNGAVERLNRTVLQMIRCFVNTGQTNWDAYLPLLMAAYRSTPHSSTRMTPNLVMLGREVSTPFDVQSGDLIDFTNLPDYVQELQAKMKLVHSETRKNLKRACKRQKRLFDLRVNKSQYAVGDVVMIIDTARKKGKSPKLQPQWIGPCLVTKRFGDVLFEVRCQKKSRVVHHNKLKPCLAETLPTWLTRCRRKLTDQGTLEDTVVEEYQCPTTPELNSDQESLRLPVPGVLERASRQRHANIEKEETSTEPELHPLTMESSSSEDAEDPTGELEVQSQRLTFPKKTMTDQLSTATYRTDGRPKRITKPPVKLNL